MKQSKVFFNDKTDIKIDDIKLQRKKQGIKADKIETCSFIIEDYFRLLEELKNEKEN